MDLRKKKLAQRRTGDGNLMILIYMIPVDYFADDDFFFGT